MSSLHLRFSRSIILVMLPVRLFPLQPCSALVLSRCVLSEIVLSSMYTTADPSPSNFVKSRVAVRAIVMTKKNTVIFVRTMDGLSFLPLTSSTTKCFYFLSPYTREYHGQNQVKPQQRRQEGWWQLVQRRP
jgi:hypothetical protein